MTFSDLVVMVADADYVVAMEAERVIAEGFNCSVRIVPPAAFAERCDVAIIEIGTDFEAVRAIAESLRARDVALIFTTAFDPFIRGIADYPEAVVLEKPYSPAALAAVVGRALAAIRGRRAGAG